MPRIYVAVGAGPSGILEGRAVYEGENRALGGELALEGRLGPALTAAARWAISLEAHGVEFVIAGPKSAARPQFFFALNQLTEASCVWDADDHNPALSAIQGEARRPILMRLHEVGSLLDGVGGHVIVARGDRTRLEMGQTIELSSLVELHRARAVIGGCAPEHLPYADPEGEPEHA